MSIRTGGSEKANEDGRLPQWDKGTRVIVFANTPEEARPVAVEIARRAHWNSSYFGGSFDDLFTPELYTANVFGTGVAAAVAVRVKADGSQSYEPVAQYSTTQSRFVSVPIDLGTETDTVYLALYGANIHTRGSLTAVDLKLGGELAQVHYAGAVPGFNNLDQVNVRVPRSILGRGEVDVTLSVDGKTANLVRINIK